MPEHVTGGERREFVRLSWPRVPHSLARLRAELRAWLSPLGFPVDVADDIVLAANEAAANVIDHAYPATSTVGTVDMDLWVENSVVHVQIVDRGRWQVADLAPSDRGLGLQLMRVLLDDVVIETGPAGTTVLLRHALPGIESRGVESPDVSGARQDRSLPRRSGSRPGR